MQCHGFLVTCFRVTHVCYLEFRTFLVYDILQKIRILCSVKLVFLCFCTLTYFVYLLRNDTVYNRLLNFRTIFEKNSNIEVHKRDNANGYRISDNQTYTPRWVTITAEVTTSACWKLRHRNFLRSLHHTGHRRDDTAANKVFVSVSVGYLKTLLYCKVIITNMGYNYQLQ